MLFTIQKDIFTFNEEAFYFLFSIHSNCGVKFCRKIPIFCIFIISLKSNIMSKKLLNDNIKLILIILLHVVLYLGGSFIVVAAENNSIMNSLGVFVMILLSIVLPLYLLSRWMVKWRTLKLAVLLFFVSDVVVNFIPNILIVLKGVGDEKAYASFIFLVMAMSLTLLLILFYGLAYYLIVRQERKLIKDSQTAYYDDENN